MSWFWSLAVSTALSCQQSPAWFSEPLSSRIANYTIVCSLDPQSKLIVGREQLDWQNTSTDSVAELQFHLYMNAFRDSNSTFLSELGHIDASLVGNWGYCRITKMTVEDGLELMDRGGFIQPDDNNRLDATVFSVSLPKRIAPDERIRLEIEFETKLPALTERAGFWQDFFLVSQWFPKIGVYENGGWNCHQYHANSEFYADFGVYDVRVTLPKEYVVGATGVLLEERMLDDARKLVRFYAEDVHDFAWVAGQNLTEIRDRIGNTEIRLLMFQKHRGLADRILAATKSGYEYFVRAYGDYPYPTLTAVDCPVFNAVMEYPMLFLTGNFDGTDLQRPAQGLVAENNRFPERLTLHELGHQWWYGMVANNEFEDAWLDEGMTEYASTKAFEAAYGDTLLIDEDGHPLRIREFQKQPFLENPFVVVGKPSWDHPNWSLYYVASYVKPKLMLYTLENHFGETAWQEVMRSFFQSYKFKHPSSENFFVMASEVTGANLSGFFQQYMNTSATLDYYVDEVRENSARIGKRGELVFPVSILFSGKDGVQVTETWDGSRNFVTYELGYEIESVIIDPGDVIEFELSKENNRWLR